ncbi:MAG TPA: MFS transporter [Chloroflexota bacterium]|nr:MFS transporter [Chloroflexota bacterium]
MGRGRWYYGWTVIAVAFLTTGVTLGTHAAFGVLLVALVDALGWGRSVVAGAISLTAVLWTLSAAPMGALFDRWGARVFAGAALLAAAGLALAATAREPWQLYLGMGVLAGIGLTPLRANMQSVVVTNWFVARRGLAVGIVASGVGLGVTVVAPLTQWVIDHAGWQAAFLVLAAAFGLGVAPLNAFVQRARPESGGQGVATRGQGKAASPGPRPPTLDPRAGPTVRYAVRQPRFWVLAVGFVFGALPLQFLLAHGVAYLVDRGFAAALAASVLGLAGLATAGGMVLWGYLVDRWGGEWVYTAGSLALMASVGVLFAVAPGREPLLYVYAALFALGFASRQGVMTTLAAALLHGPAFGALMGILAANIALGSALGPFLGGWIFDHTGSYELAFALAMGSALLSLACVWVAAPRRGRLGAAPAPAPERPAPAVVR